MKDLIETVARALVDRPEAIRISEASDGDLTTYELTLAPEDLGRVIGREGRTARALRALASAAARKQNRRVLIRIQG